MNKLAGIFLAAVMLLSACAAESRVEGEARTIVEAPERDSSKAKDGGDRKPPTKKQRKPDGGPSEEASAGVGSTEGASDTEDGDEGASTNGRSGTRSQGGAAAYPAAGTYTFTQSGYEEFCDSAGRCDKEDLPARQPTDVSYGRRSASSAVVVTEQQASGSRLARTWTRFTERGAHITKAHVEFEYSGFRFERTYVPDPPVEALRFPLTAGEEWSGRWKAATSGSYSIRVGEPTRMRIGGRAVTAYPVDTTTRFSGDFEGRSRITAYIDARTKAVVATDGVLNVTSQYGRYTTVFETKLASGPGY